MSSFTTAIYLFSFLFLLHTTKSVARVPKSLVVGMTDSFEFIDETFHNIVSFACEVHHQNLVENNVNFCNALHASDLQERKKFLNKACGGHSIETRHTLSNAAASLKKLSSASGIQEQFEKYTLKTLKDFANAMDADGLYSSSCHAKQLTLINRILIEGSFGTSNSELSRILMLESEFQGNTRKKTLPDKQKEFIQILETRLAQMSVQKCYEKISDINEDIKDSGCSTPKVNLCQNLHFARSSRDKYLVKKLDSDKNVKKISASLNKINNDYIELINQMCIDQDEKTRMIKRVKQTTIILENPRSYPLHGAHCLDADTDSPKIYLPPDYIAMYNLGFVKSVEATIMHELAHVIDGQESNRIEKYNKSCRPQDPTIKECLTGNYYLDKYSETNSDRRLKESFADELAYHIINKRLESRLQELGPENTGEKQQAMNEVLQQVCSRNALDKAGTYRPGYGSGSHPHAVDRAYNLLKKSAIRKNLNCNPKIMAPVPDQTCGVPWE